MKKIVVSIFIIMYLMVLMKPYVPLISYAVKKDYIANTLCENKDKPMMHCDGKCHLSKEIKKAASEESKSQNTTRIIQEDYSVVCLETSTNLFDNISSDITDANTFYLNNYSFQNFSFTFHPPQV